jgi:hypothetical protein
VHSLRIRPTPAPTLTCAVAIARLRGRFTSCVHHRFRCRRTSHLSSLPSPCSSTPICCSRAMVAAASRPTLVNARTGRVGHAPGLSPCVPSRRIWWRLPRLGYLSVEHQIERADGPDGPRLWAGRSARAQNRLGFRVLCYGC